MSLILCSLFAFLLSLAPFFMKITSVCGRILLGALNLFSSPELGHFFDNRLLLRILYVVGFILFLVAYLTLKGFPDQPPIKKERKMKKILLPPPRLREKKRALPLTNADREYCPLHPPLADYCNSANGGV